MNEAICSRSGNLLQFLIYDHLNFDRSVRGQAAHHMLRAFLLLNISSSTQIHVLLVHRSQSFNMLFVCAPDPNLMHAKYGNLEATIYAPPLEKPQRPQTSPSIMAWI